MSPNRYLRYDNHTTNYVIHVLHFYAVYDDQLY